MTAGATQLAAATASRVGATVYAALSAAYLLAGATLSIASYHTLNPDAVAYVQVARHWANGNIDLAVGSYWGPMLSWLLAPAYWLGADPLEWFRGLSVVLGLGMAAGAWALVRELCPTSARLPACAYGLGLLLALRMLPAPLTPDMLLACVITWYLAASLKLAATGAWRWILLCGLLGAVAYMTKAYAAAFVPTQLAIVAVGRYLSNRQAGLARAAGPPAAALAVMAAAALPWVVAISRHDGRFTIGSSGGLTAQFARWHRADGDYTPLTRLCEPRAGRLTTWENPTELPASNFERRTPWPPEPSLAEATMGNARRLATIIARGDLLGVLLSGGLVCAATAFRRRKLNAASPALVLAAGAAVYVGGYLPVLVEDRYFWPVWPVLGALSLRGIALLWSGAPRARAAACGLVVAVAAVMTAHNSWLWLAGPRADDGRWTAAVARRLGPAPLTVSNNWYYGLYVSYWNDSRFAGKISSRDPAAIARELAPLGPVRVLVFHDARLAQLLAESPGFTPGWLPLSGVAAFEYRP
jgi:hypothetical protein